jgi:transposase InsO family protein
MTCRISLYSPEIKVLAYRVQWLSDNSTCYSSNETVSFGSMIGFDARTTPSYSPESNGTAEALVKAIKLDYV